MTVSCWQLRLGVTFLAVSRLHVGCRMKIEKYGIDLDLNLTTARMVAEQNESKATFEDIINFLFLSALGTVLFGVWCQIFQCERLMNVCRRRQQELEELHEELEYQLRPMLEKSGKLTSLFYAS